MNDPSVSVIIPTYKRPQQCLRAVRSVLLQTFQDFEIIVGDDYGQDETQKLLEALNDPRVRYFDNQGNGGSASKNRNLCFERSRGQYITFLDSDDFILPNKLQLQVDALEDTDAGIGFVISGTRVVKVRDGQYYRYKDLIPTAEGDLREAYFSRRLCCYNTSMMVKREALVAVGGWDPGVGPYDDSELLMRLALRYEAARVEDVGTLWFDHDLESFSSDQAARVDGLQRFLDKHHTLLSEYPDWAEFRIAELIKLLSKTARTRELRCWCGMLSKRLLSEANLFYLLSYLPGHHYLFNGLRHFAAKYRKPSWAKAGPVPLQALIPEKSQKQVLQII